MTLPAETLLVDLLESYIAKKLARAACSTTYQYRLNFRRFDEFLQRRATLADLSAEKVLAACNWLERVKKLSAASASKFRDNFSAFWQFLARGGIVTVWPELPVIREPKRIPIAWNQSELMRLWSVLKRWPGSMDGVPANLWYCAFHGVIWSTGERAGATLQIRWDDIDLETGWIVIRAETRKGKLEDRLHRLHQPVIDLLKQIRSPTRQLVFPWPYANREYLWVKYGEILVAAGLPNDRRHKFHCLRKSVATLTKLFGGNAQEVMGHSTPQMTEDVYIDPRIAPPQQASDVLPWWFDNAV